MDPLFSFKTLVAETVENGRIFFFFLPLERLSPPANLASLLASQTCRNKLYFYTHTRPEANKNSLACILEHQFMMKSVCLVLINRGGL